MVYKQFKLETFQREELERVFDQIVNSKQNANANAAAAAAVAAASTTTTTTNPSSLSPPTVDIHALTQFLINRNHHPSTPMEQKAEKKNLTQPTQPATQISSQQEQAQQILDWLSPPKNSQESTATSSSSIQLTRSQFVERITTLASTVDYKASAPVILSMWLVGTSVGVMNPVMPFLVEALQLSASQYGTVVSGFAASKMICNIPAAILVERHGRKPYMVGSLIWIAMGVMGMGCAETAWQLYACRFVTGMGVAALSTAGTLLVSDLSTPLNRASTYAPVLSAFATGTAFGPALGGYLVDTIGIQTTLYAVGCSYMGVAALNKAILTETKMNNNDTTPIISSSTKAGATTSRGSLSNEISNAVSQWGQLIYHHPAIRSVVALNGIYWMALSGSQMTLLPLILTEDLGFTATQVGQVYMGMSLVQILGTEPSVRKGKNSHLFWTNIYSMRICSHIQIFATTTYRKSSVCQNQRYDRKSSRHGGCHELDRRCHGDAAILLWNGGFKYRYRRSTSHDAFVLHDVGIVECWFVHVIDGTTRVRDGSRGRSATCPSHCFNAHMWGCRFLIRCYQHRMVGRLDRKFGSCHAIQCRRFVVGHRLVRDSTNVFEYFPF
jgi:MFS family permease